MKLSTIFFISLTIIFAVATVRAQEVIGEGPFEAFNNEVLQTNTETSDVGIWMELYHLLISLGTRVQHLFGLPLKMVINYGHISGEETSELHSTPDQEIPDQETSIESSENKIQPVPETAIESSVNKIQPVQEPAIESSVNKIQPVQQMAVENTGNKNTPVQGLPVNGTNTKFMDALRKGVGEEKPQQAN